MLRILGCILALMIATGCSSAMGPDASIRVPAQASAPGPALNMYWPCLLEIPTPDVLKERYSVIVDGNTVGDIGRCEYRRFEVTSGRHEVKVKSPMLLVDLAGAFGLKGPYYTVPPGAPIYIRLTFFKYVEYREVPAEVGIREITNMAKN